MSRLPIEATFFVLRSPLLPVDRVVTWSEGVRGAVVEPDRLSDLEATLAADRELLRNRLISEFTDPTIREALFLASPEVESRLATFVEEAKESPGSNDITKMERTLVKYYQRMWGRSTPFGLFAGCTLGKIGPETHLSLNSAPEASRHTRLDMEYLCTLVEALEKNPSIRAALRYFPNSSLYSAGGRYRYAESRISPGRKRSYHLVGVEVDEVLEAVLERSRAGATPSDLEKMLEELCPEADSDEVRNFVDELIETQLLVSDLSPPVTGEEPVRGLADRLATIHGAEEIGAVLQEVADALHETDTRKRGASPKSYRKLAQKLEALPTPVKIPRLFQVDLVKTSPRSVLSKSVERTVAEGIEILRRVTPPNRDLLAPFREAFAERYGDREVSLTQVLDEEIGIGMGGILDPFADELPLLRGLGFFLNSSGGDSRPWGPREDFLLRKVYELGQTKEQEWSLEKADVETLAPLELPQLPDAFSATIVVLDPGSSDPEKHRPHRIWLEAAAGPSGGRLLGRFAHADPTLDQELQNHLRAEEARKPDALFAEVVHLPEGRTGNVLQRPVLRAAEIPFLGVSGAPRNLQIPIGDLIVSLDGGKIRLRSARLQKEIIPRLTTAHNFVDRGMLLYRFLCGLQLQDVSPGLMWNWGALEGAPFLPRVRYKNVVLSRKTWNLDLDQIRSLCENTATNRFRKAQELRREKNLPRLVLFQQGDQELPIDFENVLSIETWIKEIEGLSRVSLVELVPRPENACLSSPEGRFLHEIVMPFVKREDPSEAEKEVDLLWKKSRLSTVRPRESSRPKRFFAPGSQWLYLKLYTGTSTADRLLREEVGSIVDTASDSGWIDRWFFLRYADPHGHLRLRFRGEPQALLANLLPCVESRTQTNLQNGSIWKVQLDVYEREIQRYGGEESIPLAEEVFWTDSATSLVLVRATPGDRGANLRWRLAFAGLHRLLDDFRVTEGTRLELLKLLRDSLLDEFPNKKSLAITIGRKYREERRSLETLVLEKGELANSTIAEGCAILERRSELLGPVVEKLQHLETNHRLTVTWAELVASFLHMNLNRLLPSAQRAQELVLYDFLFRIYDSIRARRRPRTA